MAMENRMNRKFFAIATLALFSLINPLNALSDEEHLIRNSLKHFFSVLKSGNVIAIESAIGGDVLEETNVLLRDNKEYGNFLRKYYQGAEFYIEKIIQAPGGVVVDVNVVFSNTDTQQYNFFLTKEHVDKRGTGKWKIVSQDRLPYHSHTTPNIK